MAPGIAADDMQVKISTEGKHLHTHEVRYSLLILSASTAFVSDYYHTLQSRRNKISTFYIPPSSMQGGKPIPTIIFNGNVLQDGASVQEMFENEMPPTRFDTQCVDCHILNPQYTPQGVPLSRSPASTITILVVVSGAVRFSEDRNDPDRQFSETFVLVPNHDRGPRGQRPKDFLIQSQDFRLVV
jgi:NTF2-related export protein 1/2